MALLPQLDMVASELGCADHVRRLGALRVQLAQLAREIDVEPLHLERTDIPENLNDGALSPLSAA
jgi:hypothetical protein